MTYFSVYEKLALSEDIEAVWHQLVPQEKRTVAGKQMRQYIRDNAKLILDYRGYYYAFPHWTRKVNIEQAKKVYRFFFQPTQIKHSYAFEG